MWVVKIWTANQGCKQARVDELKSLIKEHFEECSNFYDCEEEMENKQAKLDIDPKDTKKDLRELDCLR